MFSLKLEGAYKIFFLTAFFVFLFFGGKALATECVTSDLGVNAKDCTTSIVYQDPGGSGLVFCGYRLSADLNWTSLGEQDGACSGSSASFPLSPFTNVASAGNYGISWIARDSAGNEDTGEFQGGKTFNIAFPPLAPSNLQTSTLCAGSNNPDIALAWTDNSNDEDGFRIYRGTVSGFIPSGANQIASRPASSNFYTDIDPALLSGVTYYYKIKAYNSFGESDSASSAGGITAPACAPTFVLTPSSAAVPEGGIQQFGGEYDPDGPFGAAVPQNINGSSIGNWTSADVSVATINNSGQALGLVGGSTVIQGTYSGIIATAILRVATLSVSLLADPEFGVAPLIGVSLTATVSGSAQGTINYKFDCGEDATGDWDVVFDNSPDNPKTAVDACSYALKGNYAAKVRVERDVANWAEATAAVTVGNLPDTTITSGPANPTKETTATFDFTATEPPIGGYDCRLDGGGWSVACIKPKIYPTVSQGNHTFEVRAFNSFGVDLTPAIWNWLVDTTLPVVSQFSSNRALLNIDNPTAIFSWQGSDAGGSDLRQVELWRRVQGGSWAGIKTVALSGSSASGTLDDTPLADGVYEYGIHLLDNAGNIGYEPSPITITVDKTAPPKPTCSPAGGTFLNSVSVTCSDTEAGTVIRYTTNDTSPNASSVQYAGALNMTSSQILTVASWDGAENRSLAPDNSYSFTITTNQAPSVSSASDSPDPLKAGDNLTFTANWSDPDAGDQTKLHVCKTDSISGQTCSGGSWCDSASFSSTSPTACNYTTAVGDAGTKNYFAFVCDDENACSASKSGTFLVDTTLPVVSRFIADRSELNIENPTVNFDWQGSDAGGSDLKQIELWRRVRGQSWPASPLITVALSGSSASGILDDTPTVDNIYEYGVHLLDNAGNMGYEPLAITVVVDKTAPPKPTCAPGTGNYVDSVTVTCSNAESGVIIRYTDDGTVPTAASPEYVSPLTFAVNTTLTVAAWDFIGNRSSVPDTFYTYTVMTGACYDLNNLMNSGYLKSCGNPSYNIYGDINNSGAINTQDYSSFAANYSTLNWCQGQLNDQTNPCNQAPSVSSASDSPDPLKAGDNLTFTANWSDPDAGDQTKLHVCKTDSISGQTCSGGSWCDTASWSSVSPTACSYVVQVADAGTKSYYAFACDDSNACSASKSGTFLVDAALPQITVFSVSPTSLNIAVPGTIISWTVTDAGGSHLSSVTAWRATYDSASCSDTNKSGCSWGLLFTQNAPADSDGPWSNSGTDSPSSGVYWYGLHVQDKVGNEVTESAAIKVTVDKSAPESHISSPSPNSFKGGNFPVSVIDIDTGGSTINPSECKYSVRYCLDSSCSSRSYSLSDQPRTCNASTPNITVGSGGNCPTEGLNTCRIIVKSKDKATNPNIPSSELDASGWPLGLMDLSVDLTDPVVNTVYCEDDYTVPCALASQGVSQTYKALVSDNVQISNCYFYARPVGGSWTEIQGLSFQDTTCPAGLSGNCYTASKDYDFPVFSDQEMRAYCWDGAGHAKYGPTATISVQENHAPQITSGPSYTTSPCSSPTTQTGCLVKFSVTATDADNDSFLYSWDLTGDGVHDSSLREPTAFYSSAGSRAVTVKIFDGRGGITLGSVTVPVTAPTLQVGLTAVPDSGVYPLSGVDLTATVSGTMYGTIDYKFDCGEDATGDWELQVYGTTVNSYQAQDLCSYSSAGTYSTKVYINKGTGNAEGKADVTVSANLSPQAAISVDYSLCGPGANASTAYNKCLFKLVNSSTDPNGPSDIKSSAWTIREKFTSDIKDTSNCLAGNPLCDWSLISTIPASTYLAELRVEDISGAQNSVTREFTVRQDITADFLCSLDNINWRGCNDPRFKPVKGGRVYFSDNLADYILSALGLPGRKSVKSDGSLGIVKRTWKKNSATFSPAEANLSNPSSIIQGTVIELIVEDDVGRSGSQSYDIQTQLPIPEWQEISPF